MTHDAYGAFKDLPSRKLCAITLNIPGDVREAGYQGRCTDCGRLFKDAESWVDSICQPKEVRSA